MKKSPKHKHVGEGKLVLQLYVSGMTQKSAEAIENIKRICDEDLEGAIELEIIDLYKHPDSAKEEQIVFSPSLVKQLPLPRKTVIGTLSDKDKVIKALGLRIKE